MLSMTGYGLGESQLGEARVVVELRALNHRFIDLRLRLPPEWGDLTLVIEELLRKRVDRGRVEALCRLEGEAANVLRFNHSRAKEAYRSMSALRDELTPGETIPLSLLACVPGLFEERPITTADAVRDALLEATSKACDALDEMRVREGRALASDLRSRLDAVRRHVQHIEERCPDVVAHYQTKLRERISRLLENDQLHLDHGRLEHEVALFADRADISEEVTRLESHCDQFDELVQKGTESVGRRLDFLLQEMVREANTMGAKSADVAIAHRVIELKADLERLREQVQNVA